MRFRSTLELNGKTATGIEVPTDVVESFGQGRRPAVRTINDHTCRGTIAGMGGRFLLPVSAEVRAAAGVSVGDELEVSVELDAEPGSVEVPADLAAALAGDPVAAAASAALSYSRQRAHVLSVEGAKKPGTRQRRIGSTVAALRG